MQSSSSIRRSPTSAAPALPCHIKAVLGIGNNKGGDKWMVTALPRDEDATDPLPTGTVDGSVEFTSTFSLCGDPHAATANAARVDLTIEIVGGQKTWFSHCDDDPATEETEGSVPLGHLGICPQ